MPTKKTTAKTQKSAKKPAKPAAKPVTKSAAKKPAIAVKKHVAPAKSAKVATKPSTKPAKKEKVIAKPAKVTAKEAPKPAASTAKPVVKPVPPTSAATVTKTVVSPTQPTAKPAAAVKVAAPPAKPAVKAVGTSNKSATASSTVSSAKASKNLNDDDELDNLSLLSGPRNVTPYTPKRGEQYMNQEQLEHFRTILLSWKKDLMNEVDRTVLHMKDEAANFPDPNDRATQESEFSLELRTRDRERKLIRKIEEALNRIEDGSYGYCIETGEEIGIKRLEARPVATLCVEAQERRERRERQYGDRDDRYR